MTINIDRKSTPFKLYIASVLACASLLLPALGSADDDSRWLELKASFFGDREIIENSDIIALEAPPRAYDAATVPIKVIAMDSGRQIKQVHVIVDKNPLPLAGIFKFTEEAGYWDSVETRIRINEYTTVRAIGELGDGSLHMTSRFVKASGGCSAPALSDMEDAMARAGKMKLLLDEIKGENGLSTTASIKISHPNNSGMQFDQISRNYIPAFFVHTIVAELDGKPVMNVDTNFSMSENPVVQLNLSTTGEHQKLSVFALDSKGNRYEKSSIAAIKN